MLQAYSTLNLFLHSSGPLSRVPVRIKDPNPDSDVEHFLLKGGSAGCQFSAQEC